MQIDTKPDEHGVGAAVSPERTYPVRLPVARMTKLAARVVPTGEISWAVLNKLFALFSKYYTDIDYSRFIFDFRTKDFVLLLESDGRPVGFTTAKVFPFEWQGRITTILYSGDTVVDREFWGEQELARAWINQIGRMSAKLEQGGRLVWFLIVKGHRTYRYLPVFARRYVPRVGGAAQGDLIALRNAIAAAKFGADFDSKTGIIRFASSQGRLLQCWVEPAARELTLPAVEYFLSANSGFRDGDELACLCELSRDNMRPRAQRWFDEGFYGT